MDFKKIVIGISSKDEEDNIGVLIKKIDKVMISFPDIECILCLADFSTDNTVEVFNQTKTNCKKFVIKSKEGKGQSMYDIALFAHQEKSDMLFYCDADLSRFDKIWITSSIEKVQQGFEVVFPFRKPLWNSGDLTRNLIIPVLAIGWGTFIHEPIGGELMLNRTAIKMVVDTQLPDFAKKYGIDIYLTTRLLNLSYAEIHLESAKGNKLRSYRYESDVITFGTKFIEVAQSSISLLMEKITTSRLPSNNISFLPGLHQDNDIINHDREMDRVGDLLLKSGTFRGDTVDFLDISILSKIQAHPPRHLFVGITFDDWIEILSQFFRFYKKNNSVVDIELWRHLEILFIARTFNEYSTSLNSDSWYRNIEHYAQRSFDSKDLFWEE